MTAMTILNYFKKTADGTTMFGLETLICRGEQDFSHEFIST